MATKDPESSLTCDCGTLPRKLTVKKENENKGRQFYRCDVCNYFQWADEPIRLPKRKSGYDPESFKIGACYRCGRWGCDATDCYETHDWRGNLIPPDYLNNNDNGPDPMDSDILKVTF